MTRVFKLSKLDLESVSLKRVEKNNKVYYNILDDKNNFLYLQTDYLTNSFPISDFKDNKKYAVQLNIEEETYNLYNSFKDYLLKLVFENKDIIKDTKKKVSSLEVLESLFQYPISEREYQDKKYYNLKVGYKTNYENKELLECDVLINKDKVANKYVKVEDLTKMVGVRNKCLYVLKPNLYVIGGNIGISFKVELVKMKKDSREDNVEVDFSKLMIDDD